MSSKPKQKVEVVTAPMLIASHEKVVRQSLQSHGLVANLVVRFPNRKRTPWIGRLGAWLVNKSGGQIATTYGLNDTIISEPSPEENKV